jgi:hypothetical protein
MIHVNEQPEPLNFDLMVRQKGLSSLQIKGIDLHAPLPAGTTVATYWRHCLDDLYTSYDGVCAYLGIFFERVAGAASVDHYIPKSRRADLAYEWSNYRLVCSMMNCRKREYEDVLDPFTIEGGWFHLELVSGRIFPDSHLDVKLLKAIQATIDRLDLDDPPNREMRARHYQEYCEGYYTAAFLKVRSPFVYAEAVRQGLL